MQHQISSFFKSAFKPVPIAILIGAPTNIVPKKPKPKMPYFSKIFTTNGYFWALSCLGCLFL